MRCAQVRNQRGHGGRRHRSSRTTPVKSGVHGNRIKKARWSPGQNLPRPRERHAARRRDGMPQNITYLKKPEYFLPSVLGPVAFDLMRSMVPSWIRTGFSYVFTVFSL